MRGTSVAFSAPMSRFVGCEYVPPLSASDARHLHGLPPTWDLPIAESSIDALERRARTLGRALIAAGRRREGHDLWRRVELLERVDNLHRQASTIEIAVQLCQALGAFTIDKQPKEDDAQASLQSGALSTDAGSTHGPAFSETARLRNRAYRWLQSALARYADLRHPSVVPSPARARA
jgi:hypothetical protein